MEQKKRHIAYKIRISDLLDGEYIKKSGWESSYIKTRKNNVSRVNIMAFIVGKETEKDLLVIDDGTGYITLRFLPEDVKNKEIQIGDFVIVIGRPRVWNQEIYIVPEILKKINKDWFDVRKQELKTKPRKKKKIKPTIKEKKPSPDNPYETILKLIRKLDSGEGAEIQDIIEKADTTNTEKIINNLLEEGEIFQLNPGRVKILE
ncbi:hypothetical protein GF327_09860 [Candidatus Woesearchaeota archaeon]|nr:hypothetical protein [Candidatus Woesearchaeota archaeon]